MKKYFERLKHLSKGTYIWLTIAVLVIAYATYATISWTAARRQDVALEGQVKELQEGLKNSQDSLAQAENENTAISTTLKNEQQKNASYSNQLDSVTTTVERLQRLASTDPQLLQKYSKVYFLNENYIPSAISNIDTKYLYIKDRPLQVHDRLLPFLSGMIDAAAKDGVKIQVISAYRSFGTQAALKSSYKVEYGAGTANQFSADQGYSEHQLGTALDFTTPSVGASFTDFEKTDTFTWLNANAYKYGFILSYPFNNSYYVYEPWHWRFVGLDLALSLHTSGKHFYDLDQRAINPYLLNFWNSTTTATTTTL